MGRSEGYYFDACNMLWSWLVQSKFRNRRLWNLRRVLFNMGSDYALSLEQFEWFCERVENAK